MNLARKLQAVRELQRLLEDATRRDFAGTVSVEVGASDGILKPIKTLRIQYPKDE